MVVTFGIEDFDKEEYIDNLKKKLDGKDNYGFAQTQQFAFTTQ